MMMTRPQTFALITSIALLFAVPSVVADDDPIPNEAEEVCSSGQVAGLVNTVDASAGTGTCDPSGHGGDGDFQPGATTQKALGAQDNATTLANALADADPANDFAALCAFLSWVDAGAAGTLCASDPTTDADNDDVPDSVEEQVCSVGVPSEVGSCAGDDLTLDGNPAADADGDDIPDLVEAQICGVGVPAEVGTCSGSDFTPGAGVPGLVTCENDLDCDGYTDGNELAHGCNPVDATSYPPNHGCDLDDVDPDDIDPEDPPAGPDEAVSALPAQLNCAGHTTFDGWLSQVMGDFDCDTRSNTREIQEQTNPVVPD